MNMTRNAQGMPIQLPLPQSNTQIPPQVYRNMEGIPPVNEDVLRQGLEDDNKEDDDEGEGGNEGPNGLL
jgi:hypothetical protein